MVKKEKDSASSPQAPYASILGEIATVIDAARRSAARSVNSIMTAAYWLIGRRIVEHEQKGEKRAAYGGELLERLSADLGRGYGRGFSRQNLQQMRQFYLLCTPGQICQTPSGILLQTVSAESSLADIESRFPSADAGQMHLYLNYAREHRVHADENPPVGLILCARKDEAVARYALEGLPNKVMAAAYRTALPDEKDLAAEIARTRAMLEGRNKPAPALPPADSAREGTKRKSP